MQPNQEPTKDLTNDNVQEPVDKYRDLTKKRAGTNRRSTFVYDSDGNFISVRHELPASTDSGEEAKMMKTIFSTRTPVDKT